LFIHLFFLIGFRNRFVVMFQWAWSYITYDRGARLITGPLPRLHDEAGQEGASGANHEAACESPSVATGQGPS
jgi:hypothetical protein